MADCHVGLISGTSMDGIDAVVVDFDADPPRVLAATTVAFSGPLRAKLDQVRNDPDRFPVAALAELDAELGEAFGRAAQAVIDRAGLSAADIVSIGSHGQTIVHRPDARLPHTLQIGDAFRIARRTGITTVADFRRADIAAGGQGAPLAPLVHRALLASPDEHRAVVNLGGIANLTLLSRDGKVGGFDTGPANCFLDLWYRRRHAGRFDTDGQWAASGTVDASWLAYLLREPFLARPAPKSTGIEYFSPGWLEARLPGWADERPADIQATLAEFSARSLAAAVLDQAATPERVIVCGGGVGNRDLIERIARRLPGLPVTSSAGFGLDPDHVEAVLFAWLARERLAARRVDTPAITGAIEAPLLGTIVTP